MNQEFKAKWIAALRSGEYKQTKGVLRDDKGFCCLGVACDLYDPNLWRAYKEEPKFSFYGEITVPPEFVWRNVMQIDKWAGELPFKTRDDQENNCCLTVCNDSGCTFDQIADLIEYFY